MSKWFPSVSSYDGAKKALEGGFYACLAFAAMNAVGIVLMLATGKMPTTGEATGQAAAPIAGILVELTLGLIAAFRFKKEKGLIWGSFILALFALEVVAKIANRTTNVGWVFLYAAVFTGLVNGIRGAWAFRSNMFEDPETFS